MVASMRALKRVSECEPGSYFGLELLPPYYVTEGYGGFVRGITSILIRGNGIDTAPLTHIEEVGREALEIWKDGVVK